MPEKADVKKTAATKTTAAGKTAAKKTTTRKTAAKKTATSKTAAKKPATRKTAAKKPAAKKTSTRKTPAKRKKPATASAVSPEQRHNMIQENAYYRAESRGFEPGMEWDNWLLAEQEIDAILGDVK